MINNVFYLLRSFNFTANLISIDNLLSLITTYFREMFDEYSDTRHGATKGPISWTFTGYEIPLFLRHGRPGGSLSALHCDSIINYAGQDERFAFISTLGHIDKIPKSEAGTDLFQACIFEETLFTTGKSILDFPRIFSAGYPSFRSDEIRRNRGLIITIESPEFKLCSIGELTSVSKNPFDQLHGSKYVNKNLLTEFAGLIDLQRRILQLRDEPHWSVLSSSVARQTRRWILTSEGTNEWRRFITFVSLRN